MIERYDMILVISYFFLSYYAPTNLPESNSLMDDELQNDNLHSILKAFHGKHSFWKWSILVKSS